MRILVVGAGAIGGYFGGRLLEARRDLSQINISLMLLSEQLKQSRQVSGEAAARP